MEQESKIQRLFQIAEPQAGYFTTSQAGDAGYSQPLVAYHANAGAFQRVGHGIFRLSRFPSSQHEDLFMAWLRTGMTGVLSHDTALSLYVLTDWEPAAIHLIVPPTGSRRRENLRLHFIELEANDITHREGLPVTTVERTLRDVARSGLPDEFLVEAMRQANRRGLVTLATLSKIARRPYSRAGKAACAALAKD